MSLFSTLMCVLKVDLMPAGREFSKIKTLYLTGKPGHLKTFRDSVTLIMNYDELLILKYDGINGLVISSTVYQKANPFKAYTFFKV